MRDVVRTYQASPFFKEGGYGRDMLQHVLCALVRSRPDVGYCQGMNFVVGALIVGCLTPDITQMALAPGTVVPSYPDVEDGVNVPFVEMSGEWLWLSCDCSS